MKQQTIQYSTADLPPHVAGSWRITAEQQIEGGAKLNKTFSFVERGVRYALPANAVYEVYPANGQQGDFSEVLPHIMIQGWDRQGDLYLLLLAEEDAFTVQQGTLEDFDGAKEWYAPQILPLEILGESKQTSCTELVIPCKQLRAALPNPKDRPFLAHLRRVATTQNKAAQTLEDGELLCIFSHRPPRANPDPNAALEVKACLVCLPGDFDLACCSPDAIVRLPLLHHWNFLQQDQKLDFKDIAGGLSVDDGKEPSGNPLLQNGYLPVRHQLRGGGKTVSWYRGPLTPVPVHPAALPEETGLADAYTVYDPTLGMMDISRSAAWQIGRLLALRNGSFVDGIQKLRCQRTRYLTALQGQRKLAQRFGRPSGMTVSQEQEPWSSQLDALCEECLQPAEPAPKTVMKEPLMDLHGTAVWQRASRLGSEHQQTVNEWLDRLCLLQDVPFSYLVPKESMLPMESLRLFYLDEGWIAALREGALTVGRQAETDQIHDLAFFRRDVSRQTSAGPRVFLLRSQMVKIWAGLEVQAYADLEGKNPRRLMRLERLGEDTMIGVFDEGFLRLELLEPPESLHLSCETDRPYRDPETAQATKTNFCLVFREDNTIDFAATAAAYPVKGAPMTPDLLAMELVQTAHKCVVYVKEE